MDIASCEECWDGLVDQVDVPYYAFLYIGRSTCSAATNTATMYGLEVEVCDSPVYRFVS